MSPIAGRVRRAKRNLCIVAAFGCVMLMHGSVQAADNCLISANNLAFGNYDTISNLTGSTTLTVTCDHPSKSSRTFNYTISLSTGPGTYAARTMLATIDTLVYNLYTTAALTTVWGDGTSGTVVVSGSLMVPAFSTGSSIVTVFGQIGGGQNVVPGAYQTSTPITATISGVPSTAPTATFLVNANVNAQCNVAAPAMNFGVVNPLSSLTDGALSMTIACTKNTAYAVGLDAGSTSGATIAQRLMANGANTMLYNLYTDSTRATVWGNTSGTSVAGSGAGIAINQALTVYGRVASGQTNLATGSYQENAITVTVTY